MAGFFKKIEDKPKSWRLKLFWLCFILSAFVLVFFWFLLFDQSLGLLGEEALEKTEPISQIKEIKEESVGLGQSLKANLKPLLEDLKNTISSMNQAAQPSEEIEESPPLLEEEAGEKGPEEPGQLPITQ